MMVKVGLAIGIGAITLFILCLLWWAVWKLRHRMRGKQIFATLEEILVENRKGLKKDVVRAFPIVKAGDLNVTDSSSKLQCPICWLAFRDGEVMRQLPHCTHVFHRHCIDPVLEQQIICPVCGTVLTDSSPKPATDRRGELSTPKSDGSTPSWVLVNRPVPLPQSTQESPSSSSDRFEIELMGEAPLLKHRNGNHDAPDWNEEQNCIDISFTFEGTVIPVEARQTTSTAAKDVDSFSFSTLQEMASEAAAVSNFRSQLRRSRGSESTSFSTDSNNSTRFSRSTSRSSRVTSSSSDYSSQKWEFAHPEHLPSLTASPDHCPFDVLPVVTDPGTNRNTTYSQ